MDILEYGTESASAKRGYASTIMTAVNE